MIKLSDYLDYLNNEIIQARKKADENSVRMAKEYAEHPYLKYFKVPRYAMPSVKLDIPLKITDIDSEEKYDFKINQDQFLNEVNDRITLANKTKRLKINELTKKQLSTFSFQSLLKTLEKKDQKMGKTPLSELKKIDLKSIVKDFTTQVFRAKENDSIEDVETLREIFSDVLLSKYKVVNTRLNNLYIDPNTTTADDKDKDKLFINLHVEMEEEGIRIVQFKNAEGENLEEIIFE